MPLKIHKSKSKLIVRFFESEAIVFNQMSSSIHLLSALGAELLLMAEEGRTNQQLIHKIIENYDFNVDQASDYVELSLTSFQSLGLLDT